MVTCFCLWFEQRFTWIWHVFLFGNSRINVTTSHLEITPNLLISLIFLGFPKRAKIIDKSCDTKFRNISSSNVPNLFHRKFRCVIFSLFEIWINFLNISLKMNMWPTKRSKLFFFAISINSSASERLVLIGFSTNTCFFDNNAFLTSL